MPPGRLDDLLENLLGQRPWMSTLPIVSERSVTAAMSSPRAAFAFRIQARVRPPGRRVGYNHVPFVARL
jgi:hypothetical protein